MFLNYRMFKTNFGIDSYLTKLPPQCAISLLKFRTTNNRLPVNKLRYSNIQRHERKCDKCHLNEVGDEFHYLFTCQFYDKQRKECIPSYYYKHPNAIKFQQLFASSNKKILLKLKYFVDQINRSVL